MGQKVLIYGVSGTGKSTSLRNFKSDEVKLIKVVNKPLPFRGKFDEIAVSDKVPTIIKELKNTDKKVIVIDDCQYIMGNEYFRRAQETGWQKFTDIGQNFFNLLESVDSLPDDVFVYFLAHSEKDDDGNERIKTIGKMLNEKLTIEGLFTIVMKTICVDGNYSFQTQNSGKDTCKSPMGMFENYLIENDLKMVDGIIREYWGYSDEKVEEVGVSKEKPSRRGSNNARTRGLKNTESPTDVKEIVEATTEEVKPRRTRNKPVEEVSNIISTPVITGDEAEEAEQAVETPRKKIDDGLTDEERAAFKAKVEEVNKNYEEPAEEKPVRRRKTLVEKMAEGGYEVKPVEEPTAVEEEKPTRRRRRA